MKIQEQSDTSVDSHQLDRLREALRTVHLNEEEAISLLTICDEYSELFALECDVITATTAVAHEI